MPVCIRELAALGCPGTGQEIALLVDWLATEDVRRLSDLYGAGDLAQRTGTHHIPGQLSCIAVCCVGRH